MPLRVECAVSIHPPTPRQRNPESEAAKSQRLRIWRCRTEKHAEPPKEEYGQHRPQSVRSNGIPRAGYGEIKGYSNSEREDLYRNSGGPRVPKSKTDIASAGSQRHIRAVYDEVEHPMTDNKDANCQGPRRIAPHPKVNSSDQSSP